MTNISYYPLGDPRQDLPNIISIPSVDTPGNTETITDTFGSNGLLASQATQGYIAGSATAYTTGFSYDTKGRLQQITGPRTDVVQHTTVAYYPDSDTDMARRGQPQTITDALSHVITLAADAAPNNTYSIFGDPLSVADPNGVITDLSYDARGRTLSSTIKGVTGDPTPLATSYVYDAAGRLTKITRPLLNGLSLTYDTSNRLTDVIRFTASTNLQEEQIVLGYDVTSQLTSQLAQACTTPAVSCSAWSTKQQETVQYDSYGRVREIDHPFPSGSKILYGYDLAGNLNSIQDENHSTANSTYNYDFANRLTSVVQTLAGAPGNQITTSFGYDLHDNLNSVIDPNSNQTTYAFDDFDRVRQQTSPVSGVSSYAYDPDDNLLTFADANGAMTTRTFDALDRVLSAMSVRSGFTTETVNWAYDDATNGNFGIGRLRNITDPSGSTTYTYDRRGLLKTEAPTILGNAYSQAYAYDGNANRTSVTYPDSSVVNYTFDFADRPLSATLGSTTFVSSASYAPFGPLTSLSFGNTKTQTLSYDLRYRPTENKLCCGKHGVALADYTYAEDGVGNITGITDTVSTGFNRTFGYDDLNRLITANTGASLWVTGSYTYDSMGNMKTLGLGGSRTASFSYSGTLPRLTSVTENGTPRSVAYDAAGNESNVGTATYGYGTRNLLESGDTLTYTYDGWGRRLVTSGSQGTRYSFFSPATALLSESALTMSGRPAIAYKYIWFAGRPIAQVDGAGTHWAFADHLGTPEIQTNTSGTITYQAEYEPYGRIFSLRSSDVHQPLRLPGQVAEQFDTGANGATERSYNNFRWYRPGWGRYSEADPLGLVAGANGYPYVLDNPGGRIDPLGLHPGPSITAVGYFQYALDPVYRQQYNDLLLGAGIVGLNVVPVVGEVLDVVAAARIAGLGAALLRLEQSAQEEEPGPLCPNSPIVIGENMNRVRAAAAELGARTYSGFPNAEGLAGSNLAEAQLSHNAEWLLGELRGGSTVIDIGPDIRGLNYPGITSDSYSLELQLLEQFPNTLMFGVKYP
ncbi:MAG TPA: RHS repeat-associated core domain-containing protein [Candidatus Tumulicola sp.]|nr:RHS repeat-associated core domain-containing protein [Candidatus Tumulicola sp.]